jgi:hypothetical protein
MYEVLIAMLLCGTSTLLWPDASFFSVPFALRCDVTHHVLCCAVQHADHCGM